MNGESNQALLQKDTKATFCTWSQGMECFRNQSWPKCPKTQGCGSMAMKAGL